MVYVIPVDFLNFRFDFELTKTAQKKFFVVKYLDIHAYLLNNNVMAMAIDYYR